MVMHMEEEAWCSAVTIVWRYSSFSCLLFESNESGGGRSMVHREDENLVMAMNLEVLDKIQSEDLASQFGRLVLEDLSEESLLEHSSQKRE